jgi:hypothetical protein
MSFVSNGEKFKLYTVLNGLIFPTPTQPRISFERPIYYVMRSKNEVLCAVVGRLAAERSEADKPAKAHKTIFAPNNIYYFFFKPS